MRKSASGIAILVFLLLAPIPAKPSVAYQGVVNPRPTGVVSVPKAATFSLDGVTLELQTSFLSDLRPVVAEPTSAIQTATALQREPFLRQLSVTAAPFGTSPPTEALPPAGPGAAASYRLTLDRFREDQGRRLGESTSVTMFGESIVGSTSVITLPIHGKPTALAISEWVAEAGRRIWILRAVQELQDPAVAPLTFSTISNSLDGTHLSSRSLSAPSTSVARSDGTSPTTAPGLQIASALSDLPSPDWWDGDCDTNYFQACTTVPAYPLGAEYRGLKACGPRPWHDGGYSCRRNFGAGATQIEWQCPEISKRFLYLAYGIPPYLGNGNDMVDNYEGTLLDKVWNCTPGRAPQPDDVMSYGRYSAYGHTSVVVESDVNAAGNGTIDVIEQNSSPTGYATHAVTGWCVEAYTDVIGWLHAPDWRVEYYADQALSEPCASQRLAEPYVFQHWGSAGPADGCPADGFGARFTRSIDLDGGEYTFALGYEGGARLHVDGQTVIDGWGSAAQHYATRALSAGQHEIDVLYRHGAGDAALAAFWWGPGFELTREAREDSSWYAEYWANQTLWWDPVVSSRAGDGPLDYKWKGGTPVEPIPTDHFSSRFRRSVALLPGRWQFHVVSDDGVRFWIDDHLIIDEWQDQVAVFTPTVTLAAGEHDLRIEHYENLGHATIGVDWERVSLETASRAWVESPSDGSVINSCPVTIEAQVAESLGPVDRLEFFAYYGGDWQILGADRISPYLLTWDCGPIADRTVSLMVHVWETAGGHLVDPAGSVTVRLDHAHPTYLPLNLRVWHGAP